MLAIILTAPPHALQVSMYPRAPSLDAAHQFTLSILNTRFSRCAHWTGVPVPRSARMRGSGQVIDARRRLAGVTHARYLLWGAKTRTGYGTPSALLSLRESRTSCVACPTAALHYSLHDLSAFRERFFAYGETALPPLPALRAKRAVAFACAIKTGQMDSGLGDQGDQSGDGRSRASLRPRH
jgi:hypothetical protein